MNAFRASFALLDKPDRVVHCIKEKTQSPIIMELAKLNRRLDALLGSEARVKKDPGAQRIDKISRAMTKFLRHADAKDYAMFNSGGWVDVDALVPKIKNSTAADIRTIVSEGTGRDKRYEWKEEGGVCYVRCLNGFSQSMMTTNGGPIDRDCVYTKLPSAPLYAVFHNTTVESWESIQKTEIKPGGGEGGKVRDVHMWTVKGEKKGRDFADVPLTIRIDVDGAMKAGIAFWLASNGVVLTDMPIPARYLTAYLLKNGRVPWQHSFFATPNGPAPTAEEEEDETLYEKGGD